MSPRPIPEKFDVAFSFAGEQRDLVRCIAQKLEARLAPGRVFFDEWFESHIAGANSDLQLQKIYRQRSKLVVPCISSAYAAKIWPSEEHQAIRARKWNDQAGASGLRSRDVLPLRVGDGEGDLLLPNAICPDVRERSACQAAQLIVERLLELDPAFPCAPLADPPEVPPAPRSVYLAHATTDLERSRERARVFLTDHGWTVLPGGDYPDDRFETLLRADLQRCRAFVQLLGPRGWARQESDRRQNEVAAAQGLPRYVYRNADLRLEEVAEPHRSFLGGNDVVATGFDDFLNHLKKSLPAHVADARPAGSPPLVRVAIRSRQPDRLWDQVLSLFYDQHQIDVDRVDASATFEQHEQVEPCHGFVVVCDEAAVRDAAYSAGSHLLECRAIQMKHRAEQRRPPVGLLYCPPPQIEGWGALVRSTPRKLHRMQGFPPDPALLERFLADVRDAAR